MDDSLQDHLVLSRVTTIAPCGRVFEVEAGNVNDEAARHALLVLLRVDAARVDLDLASDLASAWHPADIGLRTHRPCRHRPHTYCLYFSIN